MLKGNNKIHHLIYLYIIGDISSEDSKILEKWINASERNRKLFNIIVNNKNIKEDISFLTDINPDALWSRLDSKLKTNKSKTYKLFPNLTKWVAGVALLTGLCSVFYIANKKAYVNSEEKYAKEIQLKPGKIKATLIIQGGQTLDLTSEKMLEQELSSEEGIKDIDTLGLRYSEELSANRNIKMHTLNIPAGGEYCVTLSDGTKVWVNSKSKLTYPNHFSDDKRVVYLSEGQAFFKVAKNENKPFYVKVKNAEIKVTGTSFVVTAYKDDDNISTSLLEGGVEVSIRECEKTLDRVNIVPGTKAVINHRNISVKTVDMEAETAWVEGRFIFESETLDNILKTMSRWYDFEIFYQNKDLKKMVFSLNIKKYENAETFLNAIEKISDIKFRYRNKTLIVQKK